MTDATVSVREEHRCYGGTVGYYSHRSASTGLDMRFAVFNPRSAGGERFPVLYYLAGLTCTEETFMIKAGALRSAARLGLLLVAPDTSPRGAGVPGEDDDWDLGTGAGFYLDATQAPWSSHYRMESWVTQELPGVIASRFPADTARQSIFGHSMGGHGALVLSLRHPGAYRSVSAFAPICAPSRCPWGEKAFGAYLGQGRDVWARHDAVELIGAAGSEFPRLPLLVDQGTDDPFLAEQLAPERLEQVCAATGWPLDLRRHEGYDHGYFFISTFIDSHLEHHAAALRG